MIRGLRGAFPGPRKLGRAAVLLAVVLGAVSVLGLTRAAARTMCVGTNSVDHFTIALPSSSFAATAGTPFTATVKALNHCNNLVTSYGGLGSLSSNLGQSPNQSNPSVTDVTGGAANGTLFPATIHFSGGQSFPSVKAVAALTAQSATLTFTPSEAGLAPVTTPGFSVNPGAPDHVEFTQQPNVGGSSSWLLKTNNSLTQFGAEVRIYDRFENPTQENGPGPTTKVTLTLNQAAGLNGQLAGGSQAPANGVATFTNLTVDQTDIGYTLTAAYGNAKTATSAPFNVYLTTSACAGQCAVNQLNVNKDTTAQVQGNGLFVFLGVATIDPSANGMPVGCQSYAKDLVNGAPAPVVVADQRSALGGSLDVTYGISKTLLQKLFGSTSGSQFIPICVGARRIALDPATNTTHAVPCYQDYNGQPQTPWLGKKLDDSGKFDQTQLSPAVCDDNPSDPGYGYFFAIVGSFQDATNPNPALEIDPGTNPTVTGWSSGGNFRFFTIEFPAASGPGPFAAVPWDGWCF